VLTRPVDRSCKPANLVRGFSATIGQARRCPVLGLLERGFCLVHNLVANLTDLLARTGFAFSARGPNGLRCGRTLTDGHV